MQWWERSKSLPDWARLAESIGAGKGRAGADAVSPPDEAEAEPAKGRRNGSSSARQASPKKRKTETPQSAYMRELLGEGASVVHGERARRVARGGALLRGHRPRPQLGAAEVSDAPADVIRFKFLGSEKERHARGRSRVGECVNR